MNRIPVRNPRSGAVDASIDPPTEQDVAALAAELRAAQPAWAALGVIERGAALAALAAALDKEKEALVTALTDDTGRAGVSRLEVLGIKGLIARWIAQSPALLAQHQPDGQPTSWPGVHYATRLKPYALVGVISPWNFPLTLAMIDAVPALMAGCAVIVKPSEVTPRFIVPLARAIAAVPALAGVFRVVAGDGGTGQALIGHVDALCFTGSVATGRKVGELCARAFIPAFLELGGKDPMIVLKSADPRTAAGIALRASIVNSGQACQSIERIYVDEAIAAPFLEALVRAAEAVELNAEDIGHGHLGPIIFDRQAQILADQLADARAKGATVLTGGTVETIGGGLWLRPTVLTGVRHDMKIMTEESFGPVLPVMTFQSVDQAIALANDSIYGLSAAVVAASVAEAQAVGEQLKVGAVSINDGALTAMVWEAEKSSFGLSGLGASRMGASGFLRFLRKQALIAQSGAAAAIDAFSEQRLRGL